MTNTDTPRHQPTNLRIGDKVTGTNLRTLESFTGDLEFIEPDVAFGLSLFWVRNPISGVLVPMDDPSRMA